MWKSMAGVAAALAVGAVALQAQSAAKIDVTIQEWATPEKSHPHDPAVDVDGAPWYTGQMKNVLGRLDPATGKIQEFPLPTPNSGPHGLVSDKEGNIWYTGNFVGLIGKLDPKTGQITLKEAPTPNSRPYGIVITSKGTPVFDLFNTNKIGTIDPGTMEIREYVLPEGARPRRIAILPGDTVYYTDYARGYLGRLDLASGKVEEFKSPAARSRGPTASPRRRTARSGTASPASSRTRWCVSIRRRQPSSRGRFHRAAASSAILSPRRTTRSGSRAAGSTRWDASA